MSGIFITATGTGIGKTHFTCLLIQQLLARGKSVNALKPIISGYDPAHPQTSDTGLILTALKKPLNEQHIREISPWRLRDPVSLHLAARAEGITLDAAAIASFCRSRCDEDTTLLVEGAGGVMAPINAQHTMRDLMCLLSFPVILLTSSELGTFSHTLCALESLISASLPLNAIVVSEAEHPASSLEEIRQTLEKLSPVQCPILTLPRLPLDLGSSYVDNGLPDFTELL